MVHRACDHEEEIRESVDVDQLRWMDSRHSDHASFGAPADRSCQMQRGARRRSTGENEFLQRRQLGFEQIDPLFESFDVVFAEARAGIVLPRFRPSVSELGTEREQVTLDAIEHRVDICRHTGGTNHAEARVGFINVAVRVDARFGLRYARATEEAGFTGVSGLGVDLHSTIIVGRMSWSIVKAPRAKDAT